MKKYVYVFGILWLIAIGVPLLFNPTIALGILFFLSCVSVPFWATELEKIEKYELYSEVYDKLYAIKEENFDVYYKTQKILASYNLDIWTKNALNIVKDKRDSAFKEYLENYVTFRYSPIVITIWLMLPLIGNEAPFEVIWGFWKTMIL